MAGTPYPVRERHIKFHWDGIQNLLKLLGIIKGEPKTFDAKVNPKEYYAVAEMGGIGHSKVEIGQEVQKGQELGNMTDLFGNILETYTAPERGWVRFLRVGYSVNVGEPLVSISHI